MSREDAPKSNDPRPGPRKGRGEAPAASREKRGSEGHSSTPGHRWITIKNIMLAGLAVSFVAGIVVPLLIFFWPGGSSGPQVWIDPLPSPLSCGPILEGGSKGIKPGQAGYSSSPWVYVIASRDSGNSGWRILQPVVVNPGGRWNAPVLFEPCDPSTGVKWRLCAIVSHERLDSGTAVQESPGALARECIDVTVGGVEVALAGRRVVEKVQAKV